MNLDAGVTDFYTSKPLNRYTTVFYYAILMVIGNEMAPRTLT